MPTEGGMSPPLPLQGPRRSRCRAAEGVWSGAFDPRAACTRIVLQWRGAPRGDTQATSYCTRKREGSTSTWCRPVTRRVDWHAANVDSCFGRSIRLTLQHGGRERRFWHKNVRAGWVVV